MLLCDLNVGDCSYIKRIDSDNDTLIRLYNLGLIEGTMVSAVLKSYGIRAYFFRNTLIAIRDKDAKKIIVGDIND